MIMTGDGDYDGTVPADPPETTGIVKPYWDYKYTAQFRQALEKLSEVVAAEFGLQTIGKVLSMTCIFSEGAPTALVLQYQKVGSPTLVFDLPEYKNSWATPNYPINGAQTKEKMDVALYLLLETAELKSLTTVRSPNVTAMTMNVDLKA